MNKEELQVLIDNELSNVLSDIYKKENIKTGDITPDQYLIWEENVNNLTELFQELIEQNKSR